MTKLNWRIATAVMLAGATAVQAQQASSTPAATNDPGTRQPPPIASSSPVNAGESSDQAMSMSTSDAYVRTGGSLMRAGRGVEQPVDPSAPGGQADPRIASMTFYAAPPPQPRVIRPHDLVTVIIKEQSEFKSEGNSKLDKKANLEAAIKQFIKLNLGDGSLENAIGDVTPTIDLEGQRTFDGKGTAARKDSLSVRMQAMVIDVKPNGNLVLAARRRIRTDDEERAFLVSGIARVEDVTTDNTILSTQLYDFDLQQDTKGTVREATRRGWLPRLLDAVNPF